MSETVILPRIKPIIAVWRKEPFNDPTWSFEFKYDGFRGILYIVDGEGYIISRNGMVFSRFKILAKEVARELKVKNAIFDGEVIVTDETRRPIFADLVRKTRKQTYVAFDILWLDGKDLRNLSLRERRKYLQRVLPKQLEVISQALCVNGQGKEFFELICAHDLEGIVAKRESDPYNNKVIWFKIKNSRYSQLHDLRKNFNKKYKP